MTQKNFQEFYEYYGTSSKEELYKKIKNGDKEVAELSNFIEYMKQDREREGVFIRGKQDLVNYLEKSSIPSKEEIKFLSLDTSKKVLGEYSLSLEELSDIKNIFQKIYHPKMHSCMTTFYDSSTSFPNKPRKLEEFEKKLDNIGIIPVETIAIMGDQKRVYSYCAENFTDFHHKALKKKNFLEVPDTKIDTDTKLFQEFSDFYVKKEILGKNLITEEEEIKRLLKVAKENLSQEHFSILEYDDKYRITNIETVFVGGLDRSIVDIKTLIPYFLNESKGICLLHNHPSGNNSPSRQDLELTRDISEIANQFKKQMYDHFIIGSKVFSFREESLIKDHRAEGIASLNREDTKKKNPWEKKRKSGKGMER